MKNDQQFWAILADAIARAIKNVLVHGPLVAPIEFVFDQTFTVRDHLFQIHVASGATEQRIWEKLAGADS